MSKPNVSTTVEVRTVGLKEMKRATTAFELTNDRDDSHRVGVFRTVAKESRPSIHGRQSLVAFIVLAGAMEGLDLPGPDAMSPSQIAITTLWT